MSLRIFSLLTACAVTCALAIVSPELAFAEPSGKLDIKKSDRSVYQFTVNDISGKAKDLMTYKGKVLLIVNTASQCGYTPQYKGLQKIYENYKRKGFEVLGFPSNDFGGQEPGTNKEIKDFCELKYQVSFPIFAKAVVSGSAQSPLFKYLTSDANKEFKGDIAWNFEKFLIDHNGKLVARFKSSIAPENSDLIAQIESLLAESKK